MTRLSLSIAFLLVASGASGQRLIVTAEGRHGAAPTEVQKDDVSVEVDRKPAKVENWTHLVGAQAALELYIVIDDGTDTDLGIQFDSLKDFIRGQPASTQIGLAYLRNGSAMIAAPLTANHEQVVKSLRIPLGEPGIAASPWWGISDLVKKWPASKARREVLLISSGADPYSPADPLNPYLQTAISDAQRAEIVVHSIYYSAAGHLGHSYWRMNWGQNYLSELGDETGGEPYWQGLGKPVSLDPFLKDLAQRLRNQYLLTIRTDGMKPGLQPVRVADSKAGISLVSATKINVQGR